MMEEELIIAPDLKQRYFIHLAYDGTGYRTDIGKVGNVGHSGLGAPGLANQGASGASSR